MNITMLALGSRGDVQPFVALGCALQAAGHSIRLYAGVDFHPWIRGYGLEPTPSSVDIRGMLGSETGLEWVEKGTNQPQQARVMERLFRTTGPQLTLDLWRACQGADAVISSFTTDFYAASIAEKLGVRHLSALLQPAMVATRCGPATLSAPFPRRDSPVNYWFTRLIVEPVVWRWHGDVNNRFRQDILGLPPLSRAETEARLRSLPVVLGYSRHVVPHPSDWPPSFTTTGYWFLDEGRDWQPPRELAQFLAQGPAPVGIGFGSMTGADSEAVTRLLLDAVARSGQRAVILSGWAGLGELDLPPTVFCLDAAPHDWLFPRLAAVVHHGGAGTTAAGLRAGVPSVLVPHLGDQLFWGERVAALGVGPRAIPRPKLTAARLGEAIRQAATDSAMRERAQRLAELVRAEDGLGTAVKVIQRALV